MKAEFQKLVTLYEEWEEAGETATLTLSTRGGKSTIKLQLESSPSSSPPATSATAHTLQPAPGRRRRRRGVRARARRNQRAAAHQNSQVEAATSASLDPPSSRPLRLLPSPLPESGRRRVMSCVGRLDVPTFSNLDGAPPPSPPPPLRQLDGVKPLATALHHSPTILHSLSPALLCHLLASLILTLSAATVLGPVPVLGVLHVGAALRGQVVTMSVNGVLGLGASGLRSTT